MSATTSLSGAAPHAALLKLPRVPYRGIEPFRYSDRRIFFARGEETHHLLRRVSLYRGVLLYGESGTGKSSLINAGFIPAAIAEGFTPERLRVQPREGEEIIIERISKTALTAGPYLPSNFAVGSHNAPQVVLSVGGLMNALRRMPAGARPLLIFDQFEEFVTLFEESPPGTAAEKARQRQEAVLAALVEVLRDQVLPAKVLLVFREDYLAKLNKLFDLCPNLSDQYLRLRPPAAAALPKIIHGPFETFPGHFWPELPKGLAEKLAREFKARSEVGNVNLSEVQIACLKLWHSGDPVGFFERKGVEGLLEEHLSETLDLLDPWLRDPASALLTHMVTPSGTRNVVSEGDLANMVYIEEGYQHELLEKALKALVRETGLVRCERRRDTLYYELVSEFLIPKIRQEKEERARRLARSERRKKLAAYALACGCLFLAFVTMYFYGRAEKARRKAERHDQAVAEKLAAEIKAALFESQLKESADAVRRQAVVVDCYSRGCSGELLSMFRDYGFSILKDGVVAEHDLRRGDWGAGAGPNVVEYDPSPDAMTQETLKKAALILMHKGHTVRQIIPESLPSHRGMIRLRWNQKSERCHPLQPSDITQPDSINDPVRARWRKCPGPSKVAGSDGGGW